MYSKIEKVTTVAMVAEMATVTYLPSFASAKNPPRRPSKLRVPIKLVTMVAELAE
jgi:hypothetical protein